MRKHINNCVRLRRDVNDYFTTTILRVRYYFSVYFREMCLDLVSLRGLVYFALVLDVVKTVRLKASNVNAFSERLQIFISHKCSC